MKSQSTEPAFSTLSICFLLIAVASALVSVVKEYESIWLIADGVCGISVVALVASLINDWRK
jgi:hypothetical protein